MWEPGLVIRETVSICSYKIENFVSINGDYVLTVSFRFKEILAVDNNISQDG